VPLNFLYFDKFLPLCILVLAMFVVLRFYIGLRGALPSRIFYIESLVYLRKFSFVNLKFLESNLLFINNRVII